MRVLFIIASVTPADWDTNSIHGIHQRMEMFIDALKELAQLDVLFYVSPDVDISESATAKIRNLFCRRWKTKINLVFCPMFTPEKAVPRWRLEAPGIVNFFQHPGYTPTGGSQQIQALEDCLQRKPDAIFAHRLLSMCPVMLTRQPLPPIFFDLDDVEPIAFMRKLRQPPSRFFTSLYYLQVPALWRGTCHAIALSRQTFVCSEPDQNYLTKRWQLPGVVTVPNAVTVPEPQPISSEPTLLLLGSYIYQPNLNAANFLIERVWSRIYQEMPEARLIIAGKEPHRIRQYGAGVPGVEFTGFVDDLDALYRRVRIVCCPIFSGSGTRIKMIEAAAYGKPIVANRIGVEGLRMRDNKDFLLADGAKAFAEACLRLLKNQVLCEELGTAARAAAIRYYDRVNILRLIQSHIKPAL